MSMNVVTLNDKVNRRSGHIAVPYKNTMIVWGGYMVGNFIQIRSYQINYCMT